MLVPSASHIAKRHSVHSYLKYDAEVSHIQGSNFRNGKLEQKKFKRRPFRHNHNQDND